MIGREIRDELRVQIHLSLDEIEDIVATALDRIAGEAVVWGADETHDFYIDRVAAKATDEIRRELELMVGRALKVVPIMESST